MQGCFDDAEDDAKIDEDGDIGNDDDEVNEVAEV